LWFYGKKERKKRKRKKKKNTKKYKTLDENHHREKKRNKEKKVTKEKNRSWVDDTACGSPTTLHVKFPFPNLHFFVSPPPFCRARGFFCEVFSSS
jgi:nucleosome binding factor SPN SPT16 subunit